MIFSLTFSNENIQFDKKKFTWRSYILAKVLFNIQQIKLINKKKFLKPALNKNSEIVVMSIAILEALLAGMLIDPNRKTQIVFLFIKKITILNKYSDFINIFLGKKTMILRKQIYLNEHATKLVKDKQLPYRLIYSLMPIELKILKTYIKIYLKIGFI